MNIVDNDNGYSSEFYCLRDSEAELTLEEPQSQLFPITPCTSSGSSSPKLYGRMTPMEQLEELLEKSFHFHKCHPFPTEHNRLETLVKTKGKIEEIVTHANETHPIIHEKVLKLIEKFLIDKRKWGTEKEQALYHHMTPSQFINRLLHKRPLVFMNRLDHYLLRDGTTGEGGFETIGTLDEKDPLTLENYLSYEEMSISAMLGMSVPTHFINRGWRNNRGQPGREGWFEQKGIYIGLVGARLEKPGFMEWKHMVITPEQNTKENGYGKEADPTNPKKRNMEIWTEFYKCGEGGRNFFPSYDEAEQDASGKHLLVGKNTYLNVEVYKKRIRMSVEPFLLEANNKALQQKTKAYVHAVGIGLGVWKLSDHQGKLMVDVYSDVIKERNLTHISDIDFSWFPGDCKHCGSAGKDEIYAMNGNRIKIHFSKRNPSQKLEGEDAGKLIVASYAWDGNSYPGNEFWLGSSYLAASGDPAAACSSTIPELQNPEINPNVSGPNTRVYKA